MKQLVLIRHGESEGNLQGIITGLYDVGLTKKGEEQAKETARVLVKERFDNVGVSELIRAQQTLKIIREIIPHLPKEKQYAALNERDYGELTGESKEKLINKFGIDKYTEIVKGWDVAAEKGESLEDVYKRNKMFIDKVVVPLLKKDESILLVSHHGVIRSIIMYLEQIPSKKAHSISVKNGEAVRYIYSSSSGFVRQ